MIVSINRIPNTTVEITCTIPANDVKKRYGEVLSDLATEVEISGFRKGKAPLDLVEKSLKKESVLEKTLSKIIPEAYLQAIKDNNIKPLVNPKIEVMSVGDDKDLVFKATTCETPEVVLGDYRDKINTLFAKDKIWVPGKEDKKPEDTDKNKNDYLNQVLDVLLKTIKVNVPDMLIEEETNRLLANILDQTQKIGLTIEQYLASKNTTSEQLKAQFQAQAQATLSLEFILENIANKENIRVTEQEIDALINKTTDPKERDTIKSQRAYISALLRRQKTLDTLVKPLT